ncbi:MAG: hypothetical protein HFE97_06345 [Oscillospiraceae bacterium]|nr:hypothetical protein [Oscillospiraceae bacterium]
MRRCIAAVLMVLLLLVTPVCAFSDVGANDWYSKALSALVADGIITDQPGQIFYAQAPVTRAEFLAMVLRAKGVTLPSGPDWQTACASAAVSAKLLTGSCTPETLDRPICRFEAAEILWRATGSVKPLSYIELVGGIADQADIPARYQTAVLQCYLTGLFHGSKNDRRFAGDTIVIRSEAVVLVARLKHPELRAKPEIREQVDYSLLLGECVTYTTNLTDRNYNINLAAKSINGTIIAPGQQFSFYRVVGNAGKAQGYRKAPAISGSETFQAYGGGLCQNASTLFNAALLANMQIDERHNHSLISNYIGAGRDATIYFGGARPLDFKFTNTLSCPIKVVMTYNPNTRALTCQIYGSSWEKKPNVTISTSGSGNRWTLTRKVNGVVNYTTRSVYRSE